MAFKQDYQLHKELLLALSYTRYKVTEVFEGVHTLQPRENQSAKIDLSIFTMVHGNEIGGLKALNEYLKELIDGKTTTSLNLALVVGNPRAAKKNVRFTDFDMNRCFGVSSGTGYELARAKELEKILDISEFTLDIHQTADPTLSDFFIFPNTPSNVRWVKNIGQGAPVIVHGLDFSSQGQTSDVYAAIKNKTAVTYEMGERGEDPDQILKTQKLIANAVDYVGSLEANKIKSITSALVFSFSQSVQKDQAGRLKPGLINLAPVVAGEVIGWDLDLDLKVLESGLLLFPKYGEEAKKSNELVQVVVEIEVDLSEASEPQMSGWL